MGNYEEIAILKTMNESDMYDFVNESVEKELVVKPDNAYGQKRFYPDCPCSKFICELRGVKTFDKQIMSVLAKYGFIFNIRSQQINVSDLD